MKDYYSYHILNPENPLEIKEKILKIDGEKVIFDGNKIICKEQIFAAVHRSNYAKQNNNMIAKIWGMEVLLHISNTHQLKKASRMVDVNKNTTTIVIISKDKLQLGEYIDIKLYDGLPNFDISDDLIELYNLKINNDEYCKQVISKGALLTLNHE